MRRYFHVTTVLTKHLASPDSVIFHFYKVLGYLKDYKWLLADKCCTIFLGIEQA